MSIEQRQENTRQLIELLHSALGYRDDKTKIPGKVLEAKKLIEKGIDVDYQTKKGYEWGEGAYGGDTRLETR